MGNIGNLQHGYVQMILHGAQLTVKLLDFLCNKPHLGNHRRGIFFPRLHGCDLLRDGILPAFQCFSLLQDLTALFVESKRLVHFDRIFALADNTGPDDVRMFPKKFNVEHLFFLRCLVGESALLCHMTDIRWLLACDLHSVM